jgi:hypothetical protein
MLKAQVYSLIHFHLGQIEIQFQNFDFFVKICKLLIFSNFVLKICTKA